RVLFRSCSECGIVCRSCYGGRIQPEPHDRDAHPLDGRREKSSFSASGDKLETERNKKWRRQCCPTGEFALATCGRKRHVTDKSGGQEPSPGRAIHRPYANDQRPSRKALVEKGAENQTLPGSKRAAIAEEGLKWETMKVRGLVGLSGRSPERNLE